VRELLENEENYVRSLKLGIKNYMSVMNRKDLPKSLRGQKNRVFGNVASIFKFHSTTFLPQLIECGDDVEKIAELFTSYVTKDYFYAYIIYAINRKKSELLCAYHVQFWKVNIFLTYYMKNSKLIFKFFTSVKLIIIGRSERMQRQIGNK
jgi:hypothetical protein